MEMEETEARLRLPELVRPVLLLERDLANVKWSGERPVRPEPEPEPEDAEEARR
jgi:hypothetical protein